MMYFMLSWRLCSSKHSFSCFLPSPLLVTHSALQADAPQLMPRRLSFNLLYVHARCVSVLLGGRAITGRSYSTCAFTRHLAHISLQASYTPRAILLPHSFVRIPCMWISTILHSQSCFTQVTCDVPQDPHLTTYICTLLLASTQGLRFPTGFRAVARPFSCSQVLKCSASEASVVIDS
jgi:hypothetical protein